jgi:hypothetical protein
LYVCNGCGQALNDSPVACSSEQHTVERIDDNSSPYG